MKTEMKTDIQKKVIELRKEGLSIVSIEKQIGVPRGTIYYWCKNIDLNEEQRKELQRHQLRSSIGRAIGVQKNKEEQQKRQTLYMEKGVQLVSQMTNRELAFVGAALYWGEGHKTRRCVGLSNADPLVIKTFIKWLIKCFSVSLKDLRARLQIHKGINEEQEKIYWQQITGLVNNQFYKTYINKVFKPHKHKILHGVLTIYVHKSTNLFYQISGMIKRIGEQS